MVASAPSHCHNGRDAISATLLVQKCPAHACVGGQQRLLRSVSVELRASWVDCVLGLDGYAGHNGDPGHLAATMDGATTLPLARARSDRVDALRRGVGTDTMGGATTLPFSACEKR